MTVDRYDVRDGGKWRYLHADAQGNAFGFHGVFHGDPSPDAIVQTFEFEGVPGHVKLDTMVASGMERGVRGSDERLEELLAKLRADETEPA
jgi:uncharacterized protein YndB with AHSA1/START domain